MLRWQADELHIGISPLGLAGVHLRGREIVKLARAPYAADALATECSTLLHTLGRSNVARAPLTPPQVRFVVDDALAQHFTVARPAGLRGLAEFDAWVAGRFASVFGLDPSQWQLCADAHVGRGAHWVSALPRSVLATLRDWTHAQGLRLASITPGAVAAWNAARTAVPSTVKHANFVWRAPASLTLATISNGAWQDVRTLARTSTNDPADNPTDDTTEDDLWSHLARERLSAGVAPNRPAYLCGIREGGADAPAYAKWLDAPTWRGQASQVSRDVRLALAGRWV